MKLADWNGFAARKSESEARGKLRGLGLANYVESSTGAPKERAEITVRPDGEIRHVDFHTVPFTDDTNEVRGFVGVTTDITEQVRTEERLQLTKQWVDS